MQTLFFLLSKMGMLVQNIQHILKYAQINYKNI